MEWKRSDLRDKFHNEQGIRWKNSQGEPDIDYVDWLEDQICKFKNSRLHGVSKCTHCYGTGKDHGDESCLTPCPNCSDLGKLDDGSTCPCHY